MGEGSLVAERYRLGAKLGEGGMGAVYLATDTLLHRNVALKLVREDAPATFVERALREARIAARVNHPNVVTIHDAGTWNGRPYIVMEHLVGSPLGAFIDQPVAPSRKLAWLGAIASALSAAHDAGLIHRDVKPDNVLVCGEIVKLLDFGIAKPLADEDRMTVDGAIVGTPLYMSPEQLRGEELTAASDQFSWGVVACELMTRELPWGKPESLPVHVARLLSMDAPNLPAMPDSVAAIIRRTLARDPHERFRTMREIAAGIDACITNSERPAMQLEATEAISIRSTRTRRVIDPPYPTSVPEALVAYQGAMHGVRDAAGRSSIGELREIHEQVTRLRSQLVGSEVALLGMMEARLNAPDQVARAAADALAQFPNDMEVGCQAFVSLRFLTPVSRMLEITAHLTNLDDKDCDILQAHAQFLVRAHREDEALAVLDRALSISPHGSDLSWERARTHGRLQHRLAFERDARASAASNLPAAYDLWASAAYVNGRGMDIVEQILERKRAHARETTQPAVAASNRANVLILEGRLGDALSVMADMPRHAQAAPTTHYVETLEQALTVATELGDDVRGAALAKAALDLEALDNLVWGRAAPGLRAAAVATLYRAGRINADRAHEILDIDRQPSTVGRWASTFAQALDIPGVLERARVTLPGDRLDRFEYFGHGASGRLLLRLGLIEDAIAELERTTRGVDAVAYPASYGRALADLSEAYEAQGDSSSAIATAEKLIALWGADPSRSADAARARVTRLR